MLEAARENHSLICLDEPEKFIGPSEVQPWINALRELCADHQAQVLVSSHHPEMIDLFASQACWLERPNDLATRITQLPAVEEGGLHVSELIARRWLSHGQPGSNS